MHTVGNYEYGFFWYLYLDGTIQMEVKLTGIVGVSAVAPGEHSDTAPLIAPQLASPNHQHLFCFRLDFALDGEANSVVETDVEPGTYRVRIKARGYRSQNRRVVVEDQGVTVINVELKAK